MFDDYSSVLLIGALNTFAEETARGIIDFETYASDAEKYEGWLIYDKSNMKVVCDTCVDELHSDIVGYYDFFPGVDIHVVEDDRSGDLFVDVTVPGGSFVVEDGRWYVSGYD